jgi:hypothetical protein
MPLKSLHLWPPGLEWQWRARRAEGEIGGNQRAEVDCGWLGNPLLKGWLKPELNFMGCLPSTGDFSTIPWK